MKKIFNISMILNMIALLIISKEVFGYNITKEAGNMIGSIQNMMFSDDGTSSGNVKVSIKGAEGGIYGSGGIWIGKGGGNGIYSNGSNVGIGTTDLSNKMNVGGDIMIRDVNKLKIGNEYIQGNGTVMNIISQGYVNMEGARNYIRGGVVTFGSTWYDENDNNYFLDLNNGSVLKNLTAKNILIGSGSVGNAELDIKSGSLGHWGIYHDTVSEELRMWNGGINRLSIGKGGEIYTNNGLLVNGDRRWRGSIMPIAKGGTGLSGCNEDQILIWKDNKWSCIYTYDTNPSPFAFTNLIGQKLNTLVESNSIIPVGYYKSIVSVTGEGSPQVSCNGGMWGTSCRISKGDTVKVRLTTANDYEVVRSITIVIGTTTSVWSVKSAPNCGVYAGGYCRAPADLPGVYGFFERPCPVGYHTPSIAEWTAAMYSPEIRDLGLNSGYWTSDYGNPSDGATFTYSPTAISAPYGSIWYGGYDGYDNWHWRLPVRCVYNG